MLITTRYVQQSVEEKIINIIRSRCVCSKIGDVSD